MSLAPKRLAELTLTGAGTPQQVTATSTKAKMITFYAPSGNTGATYISGTSVSASHNIPIANGGSRTLEASADHGDDGTFDLSDFWWDSATNGNKIRVEYFD